MTTEIIFTITAQKVRLPKGLTEEQLRERLEKQVYDIYISSDCFVELIEGPYFGTLHESFNFTDPILINLPYTNESDNPNMTFAQYMSINRARDALTWCCTKCRDSYHGLLSEDGYLQIRFPIEI
jgi:hypothetical protein